MGVPVVDPALSREAAVGLVRTLREAGHVAYFAGGCVRDELLGLVPSDYDVATDATPPRLKQLFPHTNEVGAAFGVMLVQTGRGASKVINEVATFRADGAYTDKRRPDSVTFSTPEADAQRRDFTVNALFLDPLEPTAEEDASPLGGKVIDFVGGRADLASRVLRAVGDPEKRLAEDHLRALRGVRLAAKLGFAMEAGTARAIRSHASDLAGVSRERIGDEVRKMLAHPARAVAGRMLGDLLLDGPALRESHIENGFAHLAALPPGAGFPPALAAWGLDRGVTPENCADVLARWRQALCLSNDESSQVAGIYRSLAVIRGEWSSMGVAARKRAASIAAFSWALLLFRVADAAKSAAVAADVQVLSESIFGLSPVPLVAGDDLIASGMKAGPRFKSILDRVYDAQLEGRVRTKETAMQYALELSRKPGV